MTSRFIPRLQEEFPYLSFSENAYGDIRRVNIIGYHTYKNFSVYEVGNKLHINAVHVGSALNDEDIFTGIVRAIVTIDDKGFRQMMLHARLKFLERQTNYQIAQDLYNIFSTLPGSAEHEAVKNRFESLKK